MNELFQDWLMRFALGGGCVCVSLLIAIAARRQLGEVQRMIRRLPPWQRTAMACLLAVCLAYGGTKTNQVDGAGLGLRSRSSVEDNILCTTTTSDYDYHPPTVTPEDIARGWQVWEVRTNAAVDYAMPEGAVLASNWWMRGAYEDVVRIGNGDQGTGNGEWLFPFGTNEYSSLWAFSWGKARFALAGTNTEIVAVGAPMSAVPYHSRLWSAADADGSRLVTWENFALNRDTNTPVNAQIELRSSGDFVTRSNEVETVCRRVDPEDWDGDGVSNDRDCRPYACDGDFFGPLQSLPEGANADAYCWIEVAADANARVVFTGDGRSDLPDPEFMIRAGETYRVRLLIGKTYTIVSSQPLDVVGRSSPSIVIDGNGTREIEVVWPVTFSALEGNGSSFMMRVVPSGLGGTFSWTQHCCGLTGSGNQFWWAHERSCHCDGCFASGRYSYEGYEKDCIGGHCCCPRYDDDDPYAPQEDDGPYAAGASVGFSKAVVIFEDAYTNMPGEVVARRSTQTTLACVAHGGETGGTATFSIENGAKLMSRSGGSLPVTRFVPPKQKIEFEIVYEGRLPSDSERDIKAKADFTERGTGTRHSTRVDRMTAVKVELESYRVALQNRCRQRHVYGVAEDVRLKSYPVLGDARWNVFINGGLVPDSPFFPVGEWGHKGQS